MHLGIKIASAGGINAKDTIAVIVALRNAELFCVETGEVVEGVTMIGYECNVEGAVIGRVAFFPAQIVGTEQPLYKDHPLPRVPYHADTIKP